jgi:crossover junction endodeoxyribonuclease RusA
MKLSLEIFGDPAPQGSKKLIRGRIIEASSVKLKAWRKEIANACVAYKGEQNIFFLGPVTVEVTFWMPRPVSVKPEKRPHPIVPPDLDKLARGLLDGIGQSEVIWGDDSQVINLIAKKRYADQRDSGATVVITEYNDSVTESK